MANPIAIEWRTEATTVKNQFDSDGYLVHNGLLTTAEIESLRSEAERLGKGNTDSSTSHSIPTAEQDVLSVHFPYKMSELMYSALSHPRIVAILNEVIGPNVKCMQSMLFFKRSGHPGRAWHQDEAFIPTRDRSLTAAWIALDDATVDNGCLWIIPGSNRPAVIWPQEPTTDPGFDEVPRSYGFPNEDKAVPLEVQAGDVVFFDGYVLHKSNMNRSPDCPRRALISHYMSAESLLPWNTDGRGDNRDVVMVAGSDPYYWKNLEDFNSPGMRKRG